MEELSGLLAKGADTQKQLYGLLTDRRNKMGKYAYFTDAELKGLQDSTCMKLSVARGIAKTPFIITRGFDTPGHNAEVGGVKDSAHLTGNAIDILCTDSSVRFAILHGLMVAGFNRLGIYENHIHADDSTTLPPNVCWYSSSA